MLYEVRFATKEEGIGSVAWEPKEGDGYQCGEREAKRRRDHLIGCSQRNEPVDGVVPWIIEVVAMEDPPRVVFTYGPGELVRDDKGNPLEHDEPGGEWARMAA
jgi:hypothetical protein